MVTTRDSYFENPVKALKAVEISHVVLSTRCIFACLNKNKDEIKWLLIGNVKNDAFRVHFTCSEKSTLCREMMNEIHSSLQLVVSRR